MTHDEKLNEQLSALVDDELDRREQSLLLARLEREPGLRGRLERYFLIGELVRGDEAGGTGLADSVTGRIAAESQEPAYGRGRRVAQGMAGLAVAASVAAVALLALQPDTAVMQQEEASTVTPVTSTPQAPPARLATSPGWERAQPEVQVQLNRYLLTHSDAAVVEPAEEAAPDALGDTP